MDRVMLFFESKSKKFHTIPKTYEKNNFCHLMHWNIRGNLIDRSTLL